MARWYWLPILAVQPFCFAGELIPSAIRPENAVMSNHAANRLRGAALQSSGGDELWSQPGQLRQISRLFAMPRRPRLPTTTLPRSGNSIRGMSFPITSADPQAQDLFNQGIEQLYTYQYREAERLFRQACLVDHECAIAYWGLALANVNNPQRARAFLVEAIQLMGNTSDRERLYIDALDAWFRDDLNNDTGLSIRSRKLVAALEQIARRYPEDEHAQMLLGLTLWDNQSDLSISDEFATNLWHLSGQSYLAEHQYFDAAWHLEASIRADHACMIRDAIFPDRIHRFSETSQALVVTLHHLGRVHDAVAVSRNLIDLPRHPKYNPFPAGSKSAVLGRQLLWVTYSKFEMWDALISDTDRQYLAPTDDPVEQTQCLRMRGRAFFRKGDLERGKDQLAMLERRIATPPDALAVKAMDELRGYILLSEGKPSEALEHFQRAENFDVAYLAEVKYLAGLTDEAIRTLKDDVSARPNEVLPLASLASLQWRAGFRSDAKITFEKLMQISGAIDLEIPAFARLEGMAITLGFDKDWRKAPLIVQNAEDLPELESLGPMSWQPSMAARWSLPDADGKRHSLSDYRGRPVIVIFYLGAGCLHCVEQLQAFAPRTSAFENAGVTLIAIGTDNVEGLKKSQQRYADDGTFPFILLSDDKFDVFREYHAFDDSENKPGHGTFLIDAEGRIRWFDTGSEPFKNVDFLLAESKRLLSSDQTCATTGPVLPR